LSSGLNKISACNIKRATRRAFSHGRWQFVTI
jgi:hypothetical protein